MIINTDNCTYDIAFNVVQIEITNRCNMRCLHCRGGHQAGCQSKDTDMPLWAIKKIIDFAKDNSERDSLEIVLSGGEPFLHNDIEEILSYCRSVGVFNEITTNGSLITNDRIEMLKKYDISNISISIDSSLPEMHDYIRQSKNAYDNALKAIESLMANKIQARIRSTITKTNFFDMQNLVKLAMKLGVISISFGAAIPVGNALSRADDLFTTRKEMKHFIDEFYRLKYMYTNEIEIITNECLHGLRFLDFNQQEANEDEIVLNGCTAGVTTFNVLSNGDLTPCSMLKKKIANVFRDQDLRHSYMDSEIIANLLDRNYLGKCGHCLFKYECGGCRVRAEYFTGDYLGSDSLCWI